MPQTFSQYMSQDPPDDMVCFEDGNCITKQEYFRRQNEALSGATYIDPQPTGRPASMPGAGPDFAAMLADRQQGQSTPIRSADHTMDPVEAQRGSIYQIRPSPFPETGNLYPTTPPGMGPMSPFDSRSGVDEMLARGRPFRDNTYRQGRIYNNQFLSPQWNNHTMDPVEAQRTGVYPQTPHDYSLPEIRRYQAMQPGPGSERTVSPRPDYVADRSGNVVSLDPRLNGYTPFNQRDMDNPHNSNFGRNVNLLPPYEGAIRYENSAMVPVDPQTYYDEFGMTFAEWLRRRNRLTPF